MLLLRPQLRAADREPPENALQNLRLDILGALAEDRYEAFACRSGMGVGVNVQIQLDVELVMGAIGEVPKVTTVYADVLVNQLVDFHVPEAIQLAWFLPWFHLQLDGDE